RAAPPGAHPGPGGAARPRARRPARRARRAGRGGHRRGRPPPPGRHGSDVRMRRAELMRRHERPAVVLLHGLGRTHRSMGGLRRHLERLGYPTWARTYRSRRGSIEELAAEVAGWTRRDLGSRPLVGVTHSMGGILIRYMR